MNQLTYLNQLVNISFILDSSVNTWKTNITELISIVLRVKNFSSEALKLKLKPKIIQVMLLKPPSPPYVPHAHKQRLVAQSRLINDRKTGSYVRSYAHLTQLHN